MAKGNLVDVHFDDIIGETDAAWQIVMENGDEHWIPKSEGEMDENGKVVTIPRWLAKKKELD